MSRERAPQDIGVGTLFTAIGGERVSLECAAVDGGPPGYLQRDLKQDGRARSSRIPGEAFDCDARYYARYALHLFRTGL